MYLLPSPNLSIGLCFAEVKQGFRALRHQISIAKMSPERADTNPERAELSPEREKLRPHDAVA
jgi:hypothetical protein